MEYSRGKWLVYWCSKHGLVIANTHFDDMRSGFWTYSKSGLRLRPDYFLVPQYLFVNVMDCGVCEQVDIGSDHRPVHLRFNLNTPLTSSNISPT